MFYYTMYLPAAITAILFLVCIIFEKRFRIKTIVIVLLAALTLVNVFRAKDVNLRRNFSLYNNIVSSKKITAYYEGEAEPVSFDFSPERKLYSLEHLEDAPVYAKDGDIASICWLKFERTDKKFTEMVRLCELKNPSAYPSHVSFAYEGKYYCFLSGRFLYKDAFYCMNRDHAAELLRLLMETPA